MTREQIALATVALAVLVAIGWAADQALRSAGE